MDLKAKGVDIALNAYTDDFYYDVSGDIAVTNRDTAAGTVYINDQGDLTWFRDLWPGHAGTEPPPQSRAWLPDPPAVARDIADTISRAIGARQAPQCRRPPDRGPPRDRDDALSVARPSSRPPPDYLAELGPGKISQP